MLKYALIIYHFIKFMTFKNINNNPEFNFQEFFDGKLTAYGAIFNFFGKLDTRFIMESQVVENPNFNKDKKVLYKQTVKNIDTDKIKDMISYAIFEEKDKTTLTYKDDMMVKPARYKILGNKANVKYKLKVEGKNITVFANDWAYMITKNHVINKIKIKKFGIPVALILMNIVKES
jgi:hypothetical protein